MSVGSSSLFSEQRIFDIDAVTQLLGSDGPLSQSLRGFEARPQQKQMMRDVLQAFNGSQVALIEAGTGTGKSIAYLIPALLWAIQTGERVLISTNTITLQEQLLHKDIPALSKALNISVKAALVKGMGNYVCKRKLGETDGERLFLNLGEKEELDYLFAWENKTREGSRSDLQKAPSPGIWDKVGAEQDTCNMNECPHFQDCHFFKARRTAGDAHILIANHNLLFADLAVRADTENYSSQAVLPHYGRVILDEAHHIEEVATEYFAEELSWMDLLRTMARIASEKQGQVQGKLPILKHRLEECYSKHIPKEVSAILGRMNLDLSGMRREVMHTSAEAFRSLHHFIPKAEELGAGEQKLRMLPEHLQRTEWSQEVLPKAKLLVEATKRYAQALTGLEHDLRDLPNERFQESSKGVRFDLAALTARLHSAATLLDLFVSSPPPPSKVRWIETQVLKTMTNVNLVDAELDISTALVNYLFMPFPTVVLCSATLSTNRKFGYIRQRLGLTQEQIPEKTVTENIYDSPFDYQKQAMLAIPVDMPSPLEPQFLSAAIEAIWETIQASRGAAFVLFTSYSMLRQCHEQMAARMKEGRFTLLKQGDDNRQSLLNSFKTSERAVLFGTDSFWEGVDVSGEALRCVVIVKLPFKVPTEPITQARTEALVAQGRNPFVDYSLPNAIVKFKQGFGRLIRNRRDRGCIVCLDSRILTKQYGKQFLDSLPFCQQLRVPRGQLAEQMRAFYRRTHYLTL